MQASELVAIMAAIIYSRHGSTEADRPETRQSAVEDAWALWHLTRDEWTDPEARRLGR